LDLDDVLGGDAEPADLSAQPEADEPEAMEGPVRGPDGRFVSTAAPQEPPPVLDVAPEPEPPAPPAPAVNDVPPGFVPERVVAELRRELRQLKQGPPPPTPNRYEDPEGYEAYREQQFAARQLDLTLNVSERFARKEHGNETVDQARDWALAKFEREPLYQQQVLAQADPYETVVQDWKREQVLSNLKDGDLDEFRAWKAQRAAQQQQPPSAPAAPVAIPSTLADAQSARGSSASAPAAPPSLNEILGR
jgi:hypothetical protein